MRSEVEPYGTSCCYLPERPEDFFGADFFAFCAGADAFTWGGGVTLTGSGSAGASFGW